MRRQQQGREGLDELLLLPPRSCAGKAGMGLLSKLRFSEVDAV